MWTRTHFQMICLLFLYQVLTSILATRQQFMRSFLWLDTKGHWKIPNSPVARLLWLQPLLKFSWNSFDWRWSVLGLLLPFTYTWCPKSESVCVCSPVCDETSGKKSLDTAGRPENWTLDPYGEDFRSNIIIFRYFHFREVKCDADRRTFFGCLSVMTLL
jgi:hypothetical protein